MDTKPITVLNRLKFSAEALISNNGCRMHTQRSNLIKALYNDFFVSLILKTNKYRGRLGIILISKKSYLEGDGIRVLPKYQVKSSSSSVIFNFMYRSRRVTYYSPVIGWKSYLKKPPRTEVCLFDCFGVATFITWW